jgi:predicted transcriptional regulator
MNFTEVSKISNLLAKEYAADFLRLLVVYKTISASEAASLLEIHIKTAQDFLEGLAQMGILKKEEVYEKKRPYFRYSMAKKQITIKIDFAEFYDESGDEDKSKRKIRERINSGAIFTLAGGGQKITTVTLFTGEGRKKEERKISLTGAQGTFLFYLPFPTDTPKTIAEIQKKASLDGSYLPEILDIVDLLEQYNVIESNPRKDKEM